MTKIAFLALISIPSLGHALGGSIVGSAQIANTEISESTLTVTNTLTVQGNSYFGTAPNISTITSAGILQLPANSTITTNGTLSISTAPDIGRVGNNPSIYVDQSGNVGIGRTTLTQALHVNGSMVVSSSYRTNNGMNNDSSVNNARLLVGNNGATIDRNITGAGEALTINQIHASATGDILQLEAAGVPKVYFPVGGGQIWGSTATTNVSTMTSVGGLDLVSTFTVSIATLTVSPNGWVSAPSQPYIYVQRAADYDTLTGVEIDMFWDTLQDSKGSWGFNTTSSSSTFVVPIAGRYRGRCSIQFNTTAVGRKYAQIKVNGTAVAFGETGAVLNTYPSAHAFLDRVLAAGDLVKCNVHQSSGGNLVVLGGGIANQFILEKVW